MNFRKIFGITILAIILFGGSSSILKEKNINQIGKHTKKIIHLMNF